VLLSRKVCADRQWVVVSKNGIYIKRSGFHSVLDGLLFCSAINMQTL
jgi:hypothetical protein